MLIELDPMISPSLSDAGNTLNILTESVVKHLFYLLQASSSLGDYILKCGLNLLTSLMDSLFTTVFPQMGKPECDYLLDLIKKGKLFCTTLLEQEASKAQMGNLNEACLLNDTLPYLALRMDTQHNLISILIVHNSNYRYIAKHSMLFLILVQK